MNEAIVAPHQNLKLSASLVATVAPFIARNDIRYYLNGINVKPHKNGGAVICATNGHSLGAIYDPNASCDAEVILHLDARTVAACGAKSKEPRSLVIINNRLAVVEESGIEVCIQAGNPIIEGNFPDYSRVIPAADKLLPGLVGNFDRELLRQIDVATQACVKAAGKVKGPFGVEYFSVGGSREGSAVARVRALPNFVGVLMPIRSDAMLTVMPPWVGLTTQADGTVEEKAAA